MRTLENTLKFIEGKDKSAIKEAWKRIDTLSKPIGSLGQLEKIAAKMAGITGKVINHVNKKNIIIMCSDNGVFEEGISSCSQKLTVNVTRNFTRGYTGVCVLSDFYGADRTVIDIGIKEDIQIPGVIDRKIAHGTKNMAKGPAMTREEAARAIEVGIETVDTLVEKGYDIFGTGEMGVCNTAVSSAVLTALTGLDVDITVGKGSGITEEQLLLKKKAVLSAIRVNEPDPSDVIDVLSKVGGFDICGMCGCFLGAAKNRVPIVMDGLISSVAALCAVRFNQNVRDFILPSHLSAEPGAKYVMKELSMKPMLDLDMRLGEGSGCPIAFSIVEASLYILENMPTFREASIKSDGLVDIREDIGELNENGFN